MVRPSGDEQLISMVYYGVDEEEAIRFSPYGSLGLARSHDLHRLSPFWEMRCVVGGWSTRPFCFRIYN